MGEVLEHLKGPIPLVGLVLMVLAGLVQQLSGRGGDRQARRTLAFGLLALGAIVCVGGLWLEWQATAAKSASPALSPPAVQKVPELPAELPATSSSAAITSVENAASVQKEMMPSAADAAPSVPSVQKAEAKGRGVAINAGRDANFNSK